VFGEVGQANELARLVLEALHQDRGERQKQEVGECRRGENEDRMGDAVGPVHLQRRHTRGKTRQVAAVGGGIHAAKTRMRSAGTAMRRVSPGLGWNSAMSFNERSAVRGCSMP